MDGNDGETISSVVSPSVLAHVHTTVLRDRHSLSERICRPDAGDVKGQTALHADDATNHQIGIAPLQGRKAIQRMFQIAFGRAEMTCIVENLLSYGEWGSHRSQRGRSATTQPEDQPRLTLRSAGAFR